MPFMLLPLGEKWKYIPRAQATPETPLWMIKHPTDKRLTWEWQGKRRVLKEGLCGPFGAEEELVALVEFLEGGSDFSLAYGRHQAPISRSNLTMLPSDGVVFSFDQLPGNRQLSLFASTCGG